MKCADRTVMERESQGREVSANAAQGTIEFPAGLLGFEEVKRYQLLGSPEEAPFLWLQMVEEPRLAFLVVSPAMIMENYHPDISAEDVQFLGLEQSQDAMVFNIVTMHKDGSVTVNLKGPIVVNRQTLIGKQVIPVNSGEFDLQYRLSVVKAA